MLCSLNCSIYNKNIIIVDIGFNSGNFYIIIESLNTVKTNFFKKFSELDNFRNCFYAFLILNFIDQAIDKLDNLFEWYSEFGSENNDTKSNITVMSN